MARQLPANISYTLLVHAGSYKDFLNKITTKFTNRLVIRYVKREAVHYYVVQVEDIGKVEKKEIYDLPIMALREEFSSYVFFKSSRAYNNVLIRMCDAKHNEDGAYLLMEHMMTPLEKSILLNLEEAESLTYEDEKQQITTYCNHDSIIGAESLNKLFSSIKVKVNNKEENLIELAKKRHWVIGVL